MPDSACRIEAPIRRMRPETGADLLARETASEIAHAVGGNSPSYFSRRSKRHFRGPSAYRHHASPAHVLNEDFLHDICVYFCSK